LSPAQSPSSAEALRDRFVLLTSSPVSEDSLNAAGELIEVLAKTEWVEISLIRQPSIVDEVGIEIEVSIPLRKVDSGNDILNGMSAHLDYLRNLAGNNFVVSVIREDCLWIASRNFTKQPEEETFAIMIPPETDNAKY